MHFFLPADTKSTLVNSKEGRGWLAKGEVRIPTDLPVPLL